MLGNIAISTDSGLKGGIFLSEIFKNVNVGAEKMVQSAKRKHEDLSSFFQHRHQPPDMGVCTCNATTVEVETDRQTIGAP